MIPRKILPLLVFLVLLILPGSLLAQVAQPDNPAVNINFPPPVFVLSEEAEIVGTANATGQSSYFVEYRPLNDDFEPRDGEETGWIPATLPQRSPTIDGVLGVWDTTSAPDGLYEIRLSVALGSGSPLTDTVSPIRVDNSGLDPFDALDDDEAVNNALLALTATAEAGGGVTTFATPESSTGTDGASSGSTNSTGPTAQVIVLSNLREGDSTLFSIKQGLRPGEELDVIGRSSRGTNWLLVETAEGERGWVAPSVVNLRGSILDVPEVTPPVPPVTRTPTPPPVPDLPDAVINNVRVDRDLVEGEAFQILVSYANTGRRFLPQVTLFCNVEPMNVSTAVNVGNLEPGENAAAALTLRIDEDGGRDVTIICRVDMNERVEEPNEDNNFGRLTTRLDND